MRKALYACLLGVGFLGAAVPAAQASTVTVDVFAEANSYVGGSGLATGFFLTAGQLFTSSSALDDTWSLGSEEPATRTSNADGLTAYYGDYTADSFSALYGTLVGRIGIGPLFVIGTSFTGVANSTGELFLYNWDSYAGDNSGSIEATVSTVPLPPAAILLGSGLAALGFARRRKASAA